MDDQTQKWMLKYSTLALLIVLMTMALTST